MSADKESELEQKQSEKIPSIKCDSCLTDYARESIAEFTCFTCELSLCLSCSRDHENHRCVRLNSEAYRQEIKRMWKDVENETYSKEKFREKKTEVFDRIDVRTELDRRGCRVIGMCVLKHSSLVVCDQRNSCIKLFDLRNYSLQRYISLSSRPYGVTEVKVVADISNSIAVTLPDIHKIVILDVNSKPARKTKVIETGDPCFTVESSSNYIYTVYMPEEDVCYWSVYIMSSDGDILHSLKSSMYCRYAVDDPHFYRHVHPPFIALLPGRIYLTETFSGKVFVIDLDGETMSTIHEGSKLAGICVDSVSENLYICTTDRGSDKNSLYKLSSDLTQNEKMVDFNLEHRGGTRPLCINKGRLFIANSGILYSVIKYITVVRVL